ncbi:helix-turn-helix domain-containing protein [Mycobacterium sp. C3-094]
MPNIDPDAKEWQKELAGRVGRAVQQARRAAGYTALELSRRCDDLGYPISRVAISKIESNSRAGKLDLAELIALAAALHTSPVALVFPGPYDRDVELFPRQNWPQFTAAQWFSALSSEPFEEMTEWRSATWELNTWRRLDELETSRDVLTIRAANIAPDEPPPTLIYKQIELYEKEIRELREALDHRKRVEQAWGIDDA